MKKVLLVGISMILMQSLSAQKLSLGNSASFYLPTNDLAAIYDPGYGFDVIADFSVIGILGITGRAGWFKLHGVEDGGVEIEDISNWQAAVGVRASIIPIIYAEGRATWVFPNDLDNEIGFTLAAGVQPGKFDINAGYHFGDAFNYFELRLGYFWVGRKKE